MKILVTGGGTSGHISPALAVIAELKTLAQERELALEFLYVGSKRGLEHDLVSAAGVPFCGVESGKLRRYFSWQNFTDAGRVPVGVTQALRAVQKFGPDVVLATGGYVAVPPVIAARLRRVPVLIHEQTTQIGLANRINSRYARRIALSFESARNELPPLLRPKAVVTGNPVRAQIFDGDPQKAIAWAGFALEEELPTLYVTGGSQGARVINRAVEGALVELLQHCRIVHQCGKQPPRMEQDFDRLTRAQAELPATLRRRYHVTPFVREEIADVFALADLVLSRAGAGTVTELCALGKAAVYVPLVPTGGDEQTKNARMCADAGAAQIVLQSDCNPEKLLETLLPLLGDPDSLRAMGARAHTLHQPGAARALAELTLSLAQGEPDPNTPLLQERAAFKKAHSQKD